jgi:predicted transcriptional regulator
VTATGKANMAVKLDRGLRSRLQALGRAKRRSPHWLMCEAIRLYVEQEEFEAREAVIARERLERYDATGEYVEHEDARKWLLSLGTASEQPAPRTRTDPEVPKRRRR